MVLLACPTLEESTLSQKGDDPKDRSDDKGDDSDPGLASRRDCVPICLSSAGPTPKTTPERLSFETLRSRGVGTLGVAGPLATSLRGTVGQWPPATWQWWTEQKGGDPRTDQAKEGTARTPGWQPKETEAPLPVATKRYSRSSVGVLHQGERPPKTPSVRKGGDPRTLATWRHWLLQVCRGNRHYAGSDCTSPSSALVSTRFLHSQLGYRPTSGFDIIVSSLNDDITHATDVMIVEKRVLVCFSVDRMLFAECGPFCALQACCEGVQMVANDNGLGVIVPVSGRSVQFGLHHWPSFLSGVVFLHEAGAGAA